MRLALLVCAAVLASSASAQTPAEPVGRWVVADGAATVRVPPDLVTVSFTVETTGRDARETFREHEADVARVLLAVRTLRIADRDIEVANVALFQRDRQTVASRRIVVRTDSLRAVPELVAGVVEAGADRLEGVEYSLRDPAAAQGRALDEAVANARTRAERMAVGSGARLGAVRTVRESHLSSPSVLRVRGGRSEEVSYQVDGVRVEGGAYSAGAQDVAARVVVEYDLVVE